jgi:hypothetical protein
MAKGINELTPIAYGGGEVGLETLFEGVNYGVPDGAGVYARKVAGVDLQDFIMREPPDGEDESTVKGFVNHSIDRAVSAEEARASAAEEALAADIAAEEERAVAAEGVLTVEKADKTVDRGTLSSVFEGFSVDLVSFNTSKTPYAPSGPGVLSFEGGAKFEVGKAGPAVWSFSYSNGAGQATLIANEGGWVNTADIPVGGLRVVSAAGNLGGAWNLSDYVSTVNLSNLKNAVFSGFAKTNDAIVDLNAEFPPLHAAIVSETERAAGAEASLAGDIAEESERAGASEGVLAGDIAAEAARAAEAEGGLQGAVTAEITRAVGAESVLAGDLSAEVSRAATAEGDLGDALANEASARAQAVADEAAAREAAIAAEEGAIAAEAGAREAADAAERLRAEASEDSLAADISALAALVPAAVPSADGVYKLLVSGGVLSWTAE